ncbi:YncE family protein, partial [Bacillus licheniformis]|uniref:YncE family protein n=1 Tax=Bacillus licheniformis TaxID=1402 RepID=UPI0034753B6E
INTPTNTVPTTISVGDNPSEIAITPDGAFAYVTNEFSGTVSVINTATNTVAATILIKHNSFPIGVEIGILCK